MPLAGRNPKDGAKIKLHGGRAPPLRRRRHDAATAPPPLYIHTAVLRQIRSPHDLNDSKCSKMTPNESQCV